MKKKELITKVRTEWNECYCCYYVDLNDFDVFVLNDLLLEGSPNVFINQNDLFIYLEHNFEGIDLPNIEGLIKSYFSLFDTEGNRHHD